VRRQPPTERGEASDECGAELRPEGDAGRKERRVGLSLGTGGRLPTVALDGSSELARRRLTVPPLCVRRSVLGTVKALSPDEADRTRAPMIKPAPDDRIKDRRSSDGHR
jgi:hypothetical protein